MKNIEYKIQFIEYDDDKNPIYILKDLTNNKIISKGLLNSILNKFTSSPSISCNAKISIQKKEI